MVINPVGLREGEGRARGARGGGGRRPGDLRPGPPHPAAPLRPRGPLRGAAGEPGHRHHAAGHRTGLRGQGRPPRGDHGGPPSARGPAREAHRSPAALREPRPRRRARARGGLGRRSWPTSPPSASGTGAGSRTPPSSSTARSPRAARPLRGRPGHAAGPRSRDLPLRHLVLGDGGRAWRWGPGCRPRGSTASSGWRRPTAPAWAPAPFRARPTRPGPPRCGRRGTSTGRRPVGPGGAAGSTRWPRATPTGSTASTPSP